MVPFQRLDQCILDHQRRLCFVIFFKKKYLLHHIHFLSISRPVEMSSLSYASSSSEMQNDMNGVEPVQVFVRIRPDHDEKGLFIDNPSSTSTTSQTSSGKAYLARLGPCYIDLIDDKTLSIPAVDENKTSTRKPSLHQITSSPLPSSSASAISSSSTNISVLEKRKLFSFDRIFPKSSNQEDIYYQISPLVKATVRGYNTTVFAYGCTGSGKSYTMTGTNTSPGIIPRAISEIFSTIEQTAATENDIYFYVRISYVELYNNNFRNLLDFASESTSSASGSLSRKGSDLRLSGERDINVSSPDPDGHSRVPERIEVRESVSAGVFLAGANLRVPVTSAQEAFQLIARGNKYRAVGATQCNDFSSR